MKATEIMIGDWVNYKGIYNQVSKADFDIYHEKWVEEIDPIPLTPEILEKNGFKKELDRDNAHYWFILTEKNTRFALYFVRSVFTWLGPLDFKYVHELQHALKLCGINREMK